MRHYKMRSRLQFGIRSLLLVTAAVAVLCSLFALVFQRGKAESSALSQIQSYVGVTSTPQYGHVEYLHVQTCDLSRLTLTPRQLQGLSAMCRLRILILNIPYLYRTDDGGRLAGPDGCAFRFPYDHAYTLGGSKTMLSERKQPSLYYTSAQLDAFLASAKQALPPSTSSDSCPVSLGRLDDDVIGHISSLHTLRELYLGGNPITDEGVRQLSALEYLEVLNLEGTQITDASMADLAELPQLRILYVNNTRVTDEGIKELRRCIYLEDLDVDGTAVTIGAIRDLRRSLPRLTRAGRAYVSAFD